MMKNVPMYELTNPQKSIWLTEQYFQGFPINNICGHVLIKKEIDLDILNTAINYFIKNNDSFKLRFTMENGELLQYFTTDTNYNFEILEINNENKIETFAKKEVNTTFDLFSSCPFNFKLFKLPSGYGGFIINAHHIISDAATLSILCREIIDNYSKLLKNEDITPKTYSYLDYINSEKEYINSSRFIKDKEYWDSMLSSIPEVATFIPKKSEHIEDCSANRISYSINTTLLNKIKKYCLKNNISIYNFLIGIYSIYIGRTNNLEEFLLRNTNFKQNYIFRKAYFWYVY